METFWLTVLRHSSQRLLIFDGHYRAAVAHGFNSTVRAVVAASVDDLNAQGHTNEVKWIRDFNVDVSLLVARCESEWEANGCRTIADEVRKLDGAMRTKIGLF